jgi:hypothetical protein
VDERVRQRTAELRRSQEQALRAERLAAIGQTVTALAHEGRNALQLAIARVMMAELRVQGRPEELDLLGRARRALGDLDHLFDDVRNFAAPIRLDLRACGLRTIWREVWAELAPRRPGRDAQLEEEPSGPDPACEADPFRLGQVFTNALEACPDPLRVVISCREVSLSGRLALQVSVQDNGPGFTPEHRQRAQEPFFTTEVKGTGLGLAIARRILEAHGGGITFEESSEGGAKILLTPRGGRQKSSCQGRDPPDEHASGATLPRWPRWQEQAGADISRRRKCRFRPTFMGVMRSRTNAPPSSTKRCRLAPVVRTYRLRNYSCCIERIMPHIFVDFRPGLRRRWLAVHLPDGSYPQFPERAY